MEEPEGDSSSKAIPTSNRVHNTNLWKMQSTVKTKNVKFRKNNFNYFFRSSQRSFISTSSTLKEGAHETALSVIMIDPLEPILMTTHFVRIPLLSNSCPA
jgi:hypothetical protein